MNNLPINYPLYDFTYGKNFPCEQFYINSFNFLPSLLSNKIEYDRSIVEYFLNNDFIKEGEINHSSRNYDNSYVVLLINRDLKILISASSINGKKNENLWIDIYYSTNIGDINELLNFNEINEYKREPKKFNIQLVRSDHGNLDVEDFNLNIPKIDVELNYGKDFLKTHNVIVERLNNEFDKGIILLHGDPGTGKSTYIKYLTSLIKNKNILFIPPSMAEMISEPSIIPFLMDNRNSILLIEDAERVIADRETKGSPAGVSNILNLTDGILGDCLNIQVIATFNMKREKIDPALLRKGRLIAEHKFDKLTVDESNKLLSVLNKEHKTNIPLTLADIYNIDSDDMRVSNELNKLGFGK